MHVFLQYKNLKISKFYFVYAIKFCYILILYSIRILLSALLKRYISQEKVEVYNKN